MNDKIILNIDDDSETETEDNKKKYNKNDSYVPENIEDVEGLDYITETL